VQFERSLIVLKNYIGDTVMASPMVRVVARISGALDILGPPVTEQILRFPDFRSRFHDPGNLGNLRQLLRTAKSVREGHYDVAILVNRSFRSALLVRLAGITKRVGHDTERRGFLLTDRIPYDLDRNEALCYVDLVRSFTQIEPDEERPRLELTAQELERGARAIDGAEVGIQLGARHDYKQIPIHTWRKFLSQIPGGKKVAFIGGPEERSLLGEVASHGTDLVGKTDLRGTMGALANLKVMVGGDTGVMHLAAALGTPTITVFGPTPAKKWGWFESPHQVLRSPQNVIENIESEDLVGALARVL
jgi:heptosyltransferase-2